MSFFLTKLRLKNKDSQHLLQLYSQTKQPAILEVISQRYGDDLYHYLCSLTLTSNVEDIMQNVWLSLLNSQSEYQPTATAKTYLFGIARKRLIDWQRKHQFLANQCDDEQALLETQSDDESFEDQIFRGQIKTKFDAALMKLSADKREAFILQQEGFSVNEISDIMQSNVDTIKSRLKSAKSILTQTLRSEV